MNKLELRGFLEDQDFFYVQSKEALLSMYPPVKFGFYRPQVTNEPVSYPCMIKQEGVVENVYGADEVYLSVVLLEETS